MRGDQILSKCGSFSIRVYFIISKWRDTEVTEPHLYGGDLFLFPVHEESFLRDDETIGEEILL